jgi:ectoine hydroxylase-related dioxygenase (phytanoyl-CoA dioxygenase family)
MLCKLAKVKKMRIWHDQTLQKNPWSNPTSWHLDNPKWSFYSKQSISIWIALDDATVKNGCLYFLPKSHKLAKYDNDVRIGRRIDALFEVYPEFRSINPVAAEVKAGDASFHNGLIAHAAGANMTNANRAAMTCAFMPDGSTYNGQQNILSESYVSKLKIGDFLNNSLINPIVGDL